MIKLLSPSQIAHITELAKDTSGIMDYLCTLVEEKSALSGLELEQVAQDAIKEHNATAAFEKEKNALGEEYGYSLCVSVNDNVVHCRPNDTEFQEGDIISIDFGMYRDGVYSDMCRTISLGELDYNDNSELIWTTEELLHDAIALCKPGTNLRQVSTFIEKRAKEKSIYSERIGYGLVTDYTGHGIGTQLHQKPIIPNAPFSHMKDYVLRPGMVICLEPMLTMGRGEVIQGSDGWTVSTADGSKACHVEDMVLITKKGPKVLTW